MQQAISTPTSLKLEKLVIASHNPGKLIEIAALIAPLGINAISAAELGLPEPEETGDSFEANAGLKAEAATLASGLPALADDSGLCVPALGDAPGIYSARWAGPKKDFTAAMERIHMEIGGAGAQAEGAAAYFVCVLALAQPGMDTCYFRGVIHGNLAFPPRGTAGFGYDPIFIPQGYDVTFGEMAANEKEQISHRTRAFALFLEMLA